MLFYAYYFFSHTSFQGVCVSKKWVTRRECKCSYARVYMYICIPRFCLCFSVRVIQDCKLPWCFTACGCFLAWVWQPISGIKSSQPCANLVFAVFFFWESSLRLGQARAFVPRVWEILAYLSRVFRTHILDFSLKVQSILRSYNWKYELCKENENTNLYYIMLLGKKVY